MGSGDNSRSGVGGRISGEGDVGGGTAGHTEYSHQPTHSANYTNTRYNIPAISNEDGICNALLLRAESALLSGQCLLQAAEYKRALTVYEEAVCFLP